MPDPLVLVSTAVSGGPVTSLDVPVPVGTLDRDILLLSVQKDDDAGVIGVTVDGWDQIGADDVYTYFRRQARSEPASYTIELPAARQCEGIMLALRGPVQAAPVYAYQESLATDQPILPGLALPQGDYFLIASIETNRGAIEITPPAGYTTQASEDNGDPSSAGSATLVATRLYSGSTIGDQTFGLDAVTDAKAAHFAIAFPDRWDVYAAADPNGPRLATLDPSARGRTVRVELNGPGSGRFTLNRHADEAPALARGNIVKCRFPWRDDYDFAFILERGDEKLAAKDEEGGEDLDYGGRGLLAYLSRARMWHEAFTVGVDISETWAEVWKTSKVPNPVGSANVDGDPDHVYVISATTRRVYKIRQSDRVIVRTSPPLWSGSDNYAGGLADDPSDDTILWALEAPWAFGGAGNTKIRKIRISDWAILDTFNLGSAVKLTDVECNAGNLWTSRFDSANSIQKRSKVDGSIVDTYQIDHGGVTQTGATGISANGEGLAYWYIGKKRALVADKDDPDDIIDVIKTTGLTAFGGDWTTEGGEDFFYPVSYTADVVWKYQLTAATPRDPVDGTWRLDEGSAGACLWRIIVEAQAGARPQQPIPDLTYDFTSALDSNGDAWTVHEGIAEYNAKIGDDVLPTALRLIPFGLVERMSPYLRLDAYNASTYGADRTGAVFGTGVVRFEKGVNIVPDLGRKERERELHSNMLAEGKDRLYATAELDDLGYVREGFIRTDIEDAGALAGTADAELDNERVINERVSFRVVAGDDEAAGLYRPFTHYDVGDLVTLHSGADDRDFDEQNVRIYAMTLEEGPAGDWGTVVIEVGSAYLEEAAAPTTQSGGSSSGGGTSGGGVVTAPTNVTVQGIDDTGVVVTEASGRTLRSAAWGVVQAGAGIVELVIRAAQRLLDLDDVDAVEIADKQTLVRDAASETFVAGYIESIGTAETDEALVLAPDGTGGVIFRAEASGDPGGIRVSDLLTATTFPIVAHRGDINPADGFPENTIEALRQAAMRGAHGVEFDVSRSSDGTFHLLHDANELGAADELARTTNLTGLLSSKTDAQLAAGVVDAGFGWQSGTYAIPTIDAAVDVLVAFDVALYFDLKETATAAHEALAQWIVDRGIVERSVLMGLTLVGCEAAKAIAPNLEVLLPASIDDDPQLYDYIDRSLAEVAVVTGSAYVEAREPKPVDSYISAESHYGEDETAYLTDMWARGVRAYLTNDLPAALLLRNEVVLGIGPPSGAAGGDLAGTYPNPSVVDDSHSHTAATLPEASPGGIGPLLLASDHSGPIVFGDVLQASDYDDLLYASEP